MIEEEVRRAAKLLSSTRNAVVLTGAGISTESGIPDFRSPGGIWDRYDPEEFTFQNFVANPAHREKYWQLSLEIHPIFEAAEPNAAHLALAELERRGVVRAVVTQNIDGLHQKAGSRPDRVIEIHGTARDVVCLSCEDRQPREPVQRRVVAGERAPACLECGGILKPATISFGQAMPERETTLAFAYASTCEVFLVIGSSLVVYPVASLPLRAKESGARLVIVNRDPTPFDDAADVVLHGAAGDLMERVLAELAD